jgi:hypothetical protein
MLHFEPIENKRNKNKIDKYIPTCLASFNPLSDIYYTIVQKSYYILGSRNISFKDIGFQVMDYLSWATCSWDQYWKMKNQ